MDTAKTQLTPQQRAHVLSAIWRTLILIDPTLLDKAQVLRPGGTWQVERWVDELVEIVRHCAAHQMEPFLIAIRERICSRCAHQTTTGHCELRDHNQCVLYRTAPGIVEAIQETLSEMQDEAYLHARRSAEQLN